MKPPEHPHYPGPLLDDMYRAIGRFMVAFSQLQHMAEMMTVLAITPLDGTGNKKDTSSAWTVVADQTAQRVMDVFFSLCYEMRSGVWNDEDFAIVNRTRKEINEIIQSRNRIAHDLWAAGHPNAPLPPGAAALRVRHSISPRFGTRATQEPVTTAALDELTEDVRRLWAAVNLIGMHVFAEPPSSSLPPGGPRYFLRIDEDDRVVRRS